MASIIFRLSANLSCGRRCKKGEHAAPVPAAPVEEETPAGCEWEVIRPDHDLDTGVARAKAAAEGQDPRLDPACWPCFGSHAVAERANKYMEWSTCVRCGARTKCKAKQGANAKVKSNCNSDLVLKALQRLRLEHTAEQVTARKVQDMIQTIKSEGPL